MNDSVQHAKSLPQAILCLAAGPSQQPVITRAKDMGLAVIGVDQNPTAPGLTHCDEAIIASTYEAAPILAQLNPLLKKYDLRAIINRSSGPPVITAAALAEALDLPGPSVFAAETLTDKSKLMAACAQRGIPAPWCQSAADLPAIDQSHLSYPCIVKPAMSLLGKSGITVVQQESDLAAAFATASRVAINGLVNVEEFLPGRDVSLTGIVQDGTLRTIVLKDELTEVKADGSIGFAGVAVPSIFGGTPVETKLADLARQLITAFDLDHTVLNISCRCPLDEAATAQPRLIEVHLDLGGDLFYEGLAPASCSQDLLGLLVKFLATGSAQLELNPLEFSPAALIFEAGSRPGPQRPYQILKTSTRSQLEELI